MIAVDYLKSLVSEMTIGVVCWVIGMVNSDELHIAILFITAHK